MINYNKYKIFTFMSLIKMIVWKKALVGLKALQV